jgi:phosphoglycolate phosphatase
MASSAPTIVFDLDGTLAETAPDIMATLNVLLEREGIPALPLERARELVGAGAKALIERGFRVSGRPLGAAQLEGLFLDFLEIYAGRVADGSHLFDGVAEALERLARQGMKLAVCTNKPIRHSRLLLEALGVADKFAAVAGRDSYPFFKPDARHLTMTIQEAGGEVSNAIMVGDSKTDISTARAAGVPVIAVPFGYTDVPVESLSPDIVIQHFDEIDSAIARLLARVTA